MNTPDNSNSTHPIQRPPTIQKKPEDGASGFLKKYVSFSQHHLMAILLTTKVRYVQTLHSSAGTVSWPNPCIIAITTDHASNE